MRAAKKSFLSVLCVICLGIAMLALLPGFSGQTAFAETESSDTLYYFVNCGAGGITDEETAYALNGTLGSGDKAYADGWGYMSGGTANSTGGGIFESKRSGSVEYKFDIDAGDYQVAVGVTSAASGTVTINSNVKTTDYSISENSVLSYEINTGGDIVIEFTGTSVAFIAIASPDAQILLYAWADGAEALTYGEVLASKGEGWFTDGQKHPVNIDYNNVRAGELNKNFNMIDAKGVFEGTTANVDKRLITLPGDLVYFANGGSLESGVDIEGNSTADVYWELNTVIFNKYSDTLINTVPDQSINGPDGAWGYTPYTTAYPTSAKQMPVKAGDPYPPAFPFNSIRCISGAPFSIEYTFSLPAGKTYNLFLGTRSFWHGRPGHISINGESVGSIVIDATNKVTPYMDLSPDASGKISIKVAGTNTDEGSVAFIAIQEVNAANKDVTVPSAVTAPEIVNMGTTSIELGNVTAGTKIQVSVADKTGYVLHEEMASDDGDLTINIKAAKLENIFQINICAISSGGASKFTTVYITDVTDFDVENTTQGWTSGKAVLKVSGKSNSGIKRLVVTFDYISTTITLSGGTEYSGNYEAEENGEYEIKLFSGNNAFMAKTITVSNIDRNPAALSFGISATNWTDGKMPVKINLDSAAGVSKFSVYQAGVKLSEANALPEYYHTESGIYTFQVITESGKIAARTIVVGTEPKGYTLTETQGNKKKDISISGDGITRVYAYKITDTTGERLTVVGTEFTIFDDASYAIMVEYDNGSSEMTVLGLSVQDDGKTGGCGCGTIAPSSINFIGGIALLLVVFAVPVFFLHRKQKASVTA